MSGGRVLSIQSHTVHGYVGNKSAVFPLQLLGFDVDPINSVQFSNHTGYNVIKGEVLNGDQLNALVDGLKANDLIQHTHLLTGYIGSQSFLRCIVRTLNVLREENPSLVYVCDPVLGDYGPGLYVTPELVETYRDELIPHATVLTPNQFEAEKLTNSKINSLEDALAVCDRLHASGPSIIVLTSLELASEPNIIHCVASHCRDIQSYGGGKKVYERFHLKVSKLPHIFTGTGDLMAALLLAWLHRTNGDLKVALEKSIASLQGVVKNTYEWNLIHPQPERASLGPKRPPPELRLIQSRNEIDQPKVLVKATRLDPAVYGILFDMDGTLTLPGQINFRAIRERLRISQELDVLSHIDGLSVAEQHDAMVVVESEELKAAQSQTGLQLQPRLHELIEHLKRRGIKLGLFTLSGYKGVDAFLAASGISRDIFDPIVTREDMLIRKPDPSVVLNVCQSWNLHPSSVLVVGDSWKDITCGTGAGCHTCLVGASQAGNDGSGPLTECSPDFIVSGLGEIPAIVDGINWKRIVD
eukprot:c45484_g1_i1.p1 GENE.c45484_g1_i1~~c45484_g1_i1.p1  ORF type:complete len:527 (-),score=112.97 c45484_g1_i1:13-1593(-)